jgi:hypothetical protein
MQKNTSSNIAVLYTCVTSGQGAGLRLNKINEAQGCGMHRMLLHMAV